MGIPRLENVISARFEGPQFNTNKLTVIVILSLNRCNDLKASIKSLYLYTLLPFEVIIFDNCSTQKKVLKYLKRLDGTTKKDGNGKVKVIFNSQNIGCSRGRREALMNVSEGAAYVATIDNDICYTAGWLEELIRQVDTSDSVGAVCAKLVLPQQDIQLNGGFIDIQGGYFARFRSFDVGKKWDDPTTAKSRICEWLPGGAMLIKREVTKMVEHRPEYLNGYEDYDYSLQIRRKGFMLVSAPRSVLVHYPYVRISKKRQREESAYRKERQDYTKIFHSMVEFLKINGLNLIKNSPFYGRGLKTQDLLITCPQELALSVPFEELSDQEIRMHFTKLVEYVKKNSA